MVGCSCVCTDACVHYFRQSNMGSLVCRGENNENLSPGFAASLKACIYKKDLQQGIKIHADIHTHGLLKMSVLLGNLLINLYAKCGAIAKAQQLFDEEMSVHDVISWSTLISGYTLRGQGKEAILCYERMQKDGLSPNATTYACVLKACSLTGELEFGTRIHEETIFQGLLQGNIVLGTAAVDMYAKCGAVAKAKKVLDELAVRNVTSWGALIAGYVNEGKGKEALDCYDMMQKEGLCPNAIVYACTLKACGITQEIERGKIIHDEIVSHGLLGRDVVLGNALVDMYAKCGAMAKAQGVLENEMGVRNSISWSTVIVGHSKLGQGKEALLCFEKMLKEGFSPDAITYAFVLKACGITGDISLGGKIHDEVVTKRLLSTSNMIGNSLIDMYAKCGAMSKALEVFHKQPPHNIVSWNALIGGYVSWGQGQDALDCYARMQNEHLVADEVTYSCILKACGITQNVDEGRKVHCKIVSQGLVGRNVVLDNSLVDMYVKCGEIARAQEVFDGLPLHDVGSWSALIFGYTQQGQTKKAIQCYGRMQEEGHAPDAISYSCILKACGLVGELEKGQQIHNEVVNQGLLEKDMVLGNALVDMYAKCGTISRAAKVLYEEMPVRDVFSWSALIAGYVQNGQGEKAVGCLQQMKSEGLAPNAVCWNALIGGYAQQGLTTEALDCFQWMEHEGTSPNAVTFICVLNACSHSGLVDAGQMYFQYMRERYGSAPDIRHHMCMVDLYSRAGHLNKATSLINQTQACDRPSLWSALLGSCGKWGNVNIGKIAFDHAV